MNRKIDFINYNLSRKEISLKVLKIILVSWCFMLAACAELELKEPVEPLVKLEQVEEKPPVESKTAISPKIMFLLLTAELAGQRGEYKLALDGYLRASAEIKDIDIIKRAASIAVFLQDEKKLDEAVEYWLAIEPSNLEARHLKAIAAIQSANNAIAIEQINFILAQESKDFDVRMQAIIKNLRKPGSIKVAYEVFTELNQQHPNEASFSFVLAYINYQSKKYVPAQNNLKQALEIKGGWVKALLLQGQVYISQNKLALATESLQKAVAEKENSKISEQIARLLINQKRFEEALDILNALHAKELNNNAIKIQLALVLLQMDKGSDEAEQLLLALVGEFKYRDQAAYYLGRIAASKRKNKSAVKWFDAVGEGKYKYEASVSSILLLMKDSELAKGLLKVREVKLAYPKKVSELSLIESEILSRDKEYQQAFDVLSSVLVSDSDNTDILYARALMAEKLGDIAVLEDDLKYILEKRPNDATALNALGYTLVDKTTRYDEAKLYIERALAIKPNEAVFIDSYGWLFFKMGDFSEARKYLSKAYQMEPQAEIAGHLVEVFMALNLDNEAKDLLEKALKNNANDSYLLKLKKQLLND